MTQVETSDRERVLSPGVAWLHLTHTALLPAWQVSPGDAGDQGPDQHLTIHSPGDEVSPIICPPGNKILELQSIMSP